MKSHISTLLLAATVSSGCNFQTSNVGNTLSSNSSLAPSGDTIAPNQTRIKFKAIKPDKPKDTTLTSAVLEIVEISFWKTDGTKFDIITGSQSVDLLALDTQVVNVLGDRMIPEGSYDEIRVLVGDNNYVISDGDTLPLKVPSGQSSGIKLKGNFSLRGGRVTEIQLQFDADKSIHAAGKKYILKPTAKIASVASLTIEQENLLRKTLGSHSEEQVRQADFIVQSETSEVTSSEGVMKNGAPMIFTYVDLNHVDILKGKPGNTTRLELLGGTVDDVTVYLPHMPIFQKDEKAVLFLKQYPSGLGLIGEGGGQVQIE